MSKLNCIDWLVDRFLKSGNNLLVSDVKKAKEMHKQEIIDAYAEGYMNEPCRPAQYYTETFETNG